jgi:hypothetical protein
MSALLSSQPQSTITFVHILKNVFYSSLNTKMDSIYLIVMDFGIEEAHYSYYNFTITVKDFCNIGPRSLAKPGCTLTNV